MTVTSRFRPNHQAEREAMPRSAGICRWCWRGIWVEVGALPGYLRAATADGDQCETCVVWIRRHPGQDPRLRADVVAERIPAERAEDDPGWRELAACEGVDTTAFDPEHDPDDPARPSGDGDRGDLWDSRRYAAQAVCGPCPVREACARAADAHGYEGVWGGRFYTRYQWVDLTTGEKGDTQFVNASVRAGRRRRVIADPAA